MISIEIVLEQLAHLIEDDEDDDDMEMPHRLRLMVMADIEDKNKLIN